MPKNPSRATYDAIAARAEVSKTTVSLVLRGLARDRIPAATYGRVEAAARELGYYPNRLVRAMQKGRTETIAVIAPTMSMEHAGLILDGIREEAARRGYSILLGSASADAEDERASAERLLQHRADGLIRFSSVSDRGRTPDWLAEAIQRGVPCVMVDDASLEGQVDCVVSDDRHGASEAVRHLASKGHTRIAHLRGDLGRTSADERAEGYLQAVRSEGLGYERILGHSYAGEGLSGDMERLFERNAPTAIFCCSDVVALMAQAWLKANGKRVALVGFSGTWVAAEEGLTTVVQPFGEMGARAVARLVARIEDDAGDPTINRLATRLILRRSSDEH